jgi:organic radical activating enzyme
MTTHIPKTFCPAKWDEILVNLGANYVYACCKSEPIRISKKEDIELALNQQKHNLLNDIQDPSCNYCWKLENQGHTSLRHQYLNNFDDTTIEQYKNNTVKIKQIEVSLGNECNFQCTYCNPKFSSQWETDVKDKPYKIYSDRYFYAIDEKNKNNIKDTLAWLKTVGSVDKLYLLGGEPLQNKHFDKVINSITSKQIGFATNFSFKNTAKIDELIKLASNYERVQMNISLDSTGKNAEFSRYGLDFTQMLTNIRYLLVHAPENIDISLLSAMTSITIRDLNNMSLLVDQLHQLRPSLSWTLNYCRDPKILTLNTLPDKFKSDILKQINLLKNKTYIKGVDMIEGAVKIAKFNSTLYGQLRHFLEEFSQRKNIEIPVDLDDA